MGHRRIANMPVGMRWHQTRRSQPPRSTKLYIVAWRDILVLFCSSPTRVSAMKNRGCLVSFGAAMVFGMVLSEPALAQVSPQLLQGKAAFTDWRADRPGLRRHIRAADLPPANLAPSDSNGVRVASRTGNEKPV